MGLKYENLDAETRRYMLEEIEHDERADKTYRSSYLTQQGQGNWTENLKEAAENGTDDSLAVKLKAQKAFNSTTTRKIPSGKIIQAKVPHNAAEVLAESEFNRYYTRGLCRRAIDSGIPRLQVYRAKQVENPREESERLIGLLVDPQTVLTDVRGSVGVETALGIPPGPGSGITVRIPKTKA